MADGERGTDEPTMPGTVRKTSSPPQTASPGDSPDQDPAQTSARNSSSDTGSKSAGPGDSGSKDARSRDSGSTGDSSPTRPAPATDGSGDAHEPPDPLRGSRVSGIWIGLIALGVLLVLLVIFITQNTQEAQVKFLGWEGAAPQAALLLAAAVAGLFLTVIAGSLRILQLRRRVKKVKRQQQKEAKRQRKLAQ